MKRVNPNPKYNKQMLMDKIRLTGYVSLSKNERISASKHKVLPKIVSLTDKRIRKRYGITLEDYRSMYEKQNGRCAICKKVWHRSLFIDHDHSTGKVRGLLCQPCNNFLAHYEHKWQLIPDLFEYLHEIKPEDRLI